ncbi:MAG: hypothetical protein PHU08_04345 [Dehalococcoidales bacterium]|nr:hypothetical protein [Dehalococcoidales bacterium]
MNIFFVIVLAALLLEFALHLVANILNLRSLRTVLPPALEGVYQPDEYRNSQAYTRAG